MRFGSLKLYPRRKNAANFVILWVLSFVGKTEDAFYSDFMMISTFLAALLVVSCLHLFPHASSAAFASQSTSYFFDSFNTAIFADASLLVNSLIVSFHFQKNRVIIDNKSYYIT